MPPMSTLTTSVLVIDDDEDTRASLRIPLEDAGYIVIEAADGQCALDVLTDSPVGLVAVFDYRAPGMDGEALLRLVEREGWLAGCHAFVCLTASPQNLPAMLSCMLVHYGVPVVGKPFELDELLAAIQQAEHRLALLPPPAGAGASRRPRR